MSAKFFLPESLKYMIARLWVFVFFILCLNLTVECAAAEKSSKSKQSKTKPKSTVEIFADGQKYPSLEEYKKARQNMPPPETNLDDAAPAAAGSLSDVMAQLKNFSPDQLSQEDLAVIINALNKYQNFLGMSSQSATTQDQSMEEVIQDFLKTQKDPSLFAIDPEKAKTIEINPNKKAKEIIIQK